ncbi:MAG: hypothetical protein WDZ84_02675 [Rhodovibrionaceae bacterium]
MSLHPATPPLEDFLRFRSRPPGSHFFGYYDKSPLDAGGGRLLAQKVGFDGRLPQAGDTAEIGYFDLQGGAFRRLADTRAFNWQQGSMLQWLGPDFAGRILFNDLEGARPICRLLDLEGGEERLPQAVYTVHPCGGFALAPDFQRTTAVRDAYGYALAVPPEKTGALWEDDGIWRVELNSGATTKILEIAALLATRPVSSMQGGAHSIEHLMFNPGGSRFCFLHRWTLEDGGIYTRLFTAAPDGGDLRLLLDSGKTTHVCWADDTTLLAWAAPAGGAMRLRRSRSLTRLLLRPILPLYHRLAAGRPAMARLASGQGYLLLPDRADAPPQRIGQGALTRDGHPSFNPGHPALFVTDTYEDAEGVQDLILFDRVEATGSLLGRFPTLPGYASTGWRCDLHPKWDFSGRSLILESLHEGSRQLYVYDFEAWLSAASISSSS